MTIHTPIWQNFWPLVKAAIPFLVTVFLAFGINVSPGLQAVLLDNIEALILSISAFASAFPSMKAAIKYRQDAD